MQVTKTQLAAALVATFGFAMHSPALANPSSATKMGASEQQAPSLLSQASTDEKGKASSCKGKEGSCKGKKSAEKGKKSSCKGKKSSCKSKETKKTDKVETKTEDTKETK